MFSGCNNLLELNSRRMEIIRSGVDVHKVNAEYNLKKKELLSRGRNFKTISIHRAPTEDIPMTVCLPVIGAPDEKTTIEITPGGLKL